MGKLWRRMTEIYCCPQDGGEHCYHLRKQNRPDCRDPLVNTQIVRYCCKCQDRD